jgi:hypothetical protein
MKRSNIQGILHQLTLREAIMEQHGYHGPETFRRNNAGNPIDGIWTMPGISISRGGYFQYDKVFLNTDHRCLWVDISYEQAFGHSMPTLFKPKARKLHCRDPRLVNNHVNLFHEFASRCDLFKKVEQLNNCIHILSNKQVVDTYEELDILHCQATAFAESKCRKLRQGNVPFSPALNKV